MTLPRIAIVDCETTGLDRHRHQIWEIAIITGDPYDDGSGYRWKEHLWHLHPDLSLADPGALRVNRFYERASADESDPEKIPHLHKEDSWNHPLRRWREPNTAAKEVAIALSSRTLIGAVPDFDAYRLEDWLQANGHRHSWYHHLVDVETLVAGYLRGVLDMLRYAPWDFSFGNDLIEEDIREITTPDWKSTDLLEAFGIPTPPGRHTALADCRWARDAYCKVYGIQV